MIVRLLREAQDDLRSIGEFIAQDNPRRAESFLSELEAKVRGLSTMAESFPFARLPQLPDVRRRMHGRYGIFYAINAVPPRVDVYRILHSSRDISRILHA